MNASENIDKVQASLTGWQREMYSRLRELIGKCAPGPR